jgi:hypothetical protein
MSGIFLNFFEVLLDNNKNTTDVFVVPFKNYEDNEKFKSLRDSYRDFCFYRSGDDLLFWKHRGSDNVLTLDEMSTKTLSVARYPFVFCRMIELGIENFFNSIGNKKLYSKFGINAFLSIRNLTNSIDGLETYPLLLFKTFYAQKADKLKFGFTLDIKLYHMFTWNKAIFVERGIDTRYLKQRDDGSIIPDKIAVKRFIESVGKQKVFEEIIAKNTSSKKIYEMIGKPFEYIQKNKERIFLNNGLKIDSVSRINLPYGDDFFKTERFNSPSYFYDNQFTINGRPSDILKERRPFSYQQFKNHKINIFIIASEKHKGNVEVFIKKLSDHLKIVFHLPQVNITDRYFKADRDILNAYKETIYESIDNADLVIPIIEEEYKRLEIEKNPYFLAKAKLMGQGIPTQEITIEKIKALNQYILNNVCLSIYAKIGGTPWTIEKIEPIRNEIIIGIGSSVVNKGIGDDKKVVGFATVFDYSGKYIVGDCSPVSSLDEYGENLKAYLIKIIRKIITSRNIGKEQEIRLIFHLYKSAGKRREIYAIDKVRETFKDYKIDFSLLHVSYGHNFKIYKDQGNFCPERGLIINLSDDQLLLNFANKLKGNPSPLLVRIDKRSSFKDLNYLAKQVFFFSFISFRSFTPSKKPITILYPSLMSRLTEQMKIIDGWDYDKLQYIGNKLWFL